MLLTPSLPICTIINLILFHFFYFIFFFYIFTSDSLFSLFFFLNDPAPPEISPLPLHAALPICGHRRFSDGERYAVERRDRGHHRARRRRAGLRSALRVAFERRASIHARLDVHELKPGVRSEEHTSELQSHLNLVCRLLLEKKK